MYDPPDQEPLYDFERGSRYSTQFGLGTGSLPPLPESYTSRYEQLHFDISGSSWPDNRKNDEIAELKQQVNDIILQIKRLEEAPSDA